MSARVGWEVRRELAGAQSKEAPRVPRNTAGRTGPDDPLARKAALCTSRGLAASLNVAPCTVLSGCAPANVALCTRLAAAGRPSPARRGTPDGISRHGVVHRTAFLGTARHVGRDSPTCRGERGTGGAISRRASQKTVQPAAFLGTRPRAAGTPGRPSITSPERPGASLNSLRQAPSVMRSDWKAM